jgi:hypothetical protein
MKAALIGGLSGATESLVPVMETGSARLTQMSISIQGVKAKLSGVVAQYGVYIQLAIVALIVRCAFVSRAIDAATSY